jgi:hypothetical protein
MIENTVRYVYTLLLSKNYEDLEIFTNSNRLRADEIKESVEEYGRQLIPYPEKIELDVIEVSGSSPQEWNVVAPIYTVEEGISDLSIELSLEENDEPIFKTELDNIRVR